MDKDISIHYEEQYSKKIKIGRISELCKDLADEDLNYILDLIKCWKKGINK